MRVRRPRWPLDHDDSLLLLLGAVVTFIVLWLALVLGLAVRIFFMAKGA